MQAGEHQSSRFVTSASTVARIGASLLGISLLAAGTVAVFVTTNSVGSAALIAAGAAIVVLVLFANQLESFEGGGIRIQLRAVASKLEEARRADAAGDTEEAEQLRAEAELLFAAIGPIAEKYEEVRQSIPHGYRRTYIMSGLVEQARRMTKLDFVNSRAVEELFNSDQDGNRIVTLGLMREEIEYANFDIVAKVIRQPRSSFEQYQALRVAQNLTRRNICDEEVKTIREAIAFAEADGSLRGRLDRSRSKIADQILREISASRRLDEKE